VKPYSLLAVGLLLSISTNTICLLLSIAHNLQCFATIAPIRKIRMFVCLDIYSCWDIVVWQPAIQLFASGRAKYYDTTSPPLWKELSLDLPVSQYPPPHFA
jgi:hypothetical protein